MKLDVCFTPGELVGLELAERVVVIDVLRATSTIVEALANGARAIFPVATADDAARIAQNIGRDSVLLCGERRGLPIEGFDLGNAPPEFTEERVSEKALVMTTTNGTRAFLAVAERQAGIGEANGTSVLAASFLNLAAVTGRLSDGGRVAVVCAGREGRFALEDAACAGLLIRSLESATSLELNDAAVAARSLAGDPARIPALLAGTAAGRRLTEIGREEDLAFCGEVDRRTVVPRFQDRKITAE
ncbi:MAG: 2-phosphosulfolactate phosphatase [Gemmatimonadota bacterium]